MPEGYIELKRGSHGQVSLVSEEQDPKPKPVTLPKIPRISVAAIKMWLEGLQRPEIREIREDHERRIRLESKVNAIAADVVNGRLLEGRLMEFWHLYQDNEIALATLMAQAEVQYLSQRRDKPTYFGTHAADILEVSSREMAVGLLIACAQPDVAREINSLKRGSDPQRIAIEGLVLLPQNIRRGLFIGMHDEDPGKSGAAYKLFALMASNFRVTNSEYSGLRFIERSLPEERAAIQVEQVGDDIEYLAPILRAH